MLKVMYINLVDMITKLIIAIESNTTGLLNMDSYFAVQNLVAIVVNMVIVGVIVKCATEVYFKYVDYVN